MLPCSPACTSGYIKDPADISDAQHVMAQVGDVYLSPMKQLAIQSIFQEAKVCEERNENHQVTKLEPQKLTRELQADIKELTKVHDHHPATPGT